MEQLDREMQKRVWQRVQSREPEQMPQLPMDNIKPLILTAQENLAAYQYLSGQMGQRYRDTLTHLQRETQKSIACMQGVCHMRGEQVKVPQIKAAREPGRRMLGKCYHRERKLWREWEQRISDPEHGVVFGQMANQSRERCGMIMELLGKLEG